MRLLIDTHALLWFLDGSPSLGTAARAAIESESNARYVSHVSAWEIAIKRSLGKLELPIPFDELFPGALHANGFIPLMPDFRHYAATINLPWIHRDPFDRLLVAQAEIEELTVVTRDPVFLKYGIPTLW